MKVKFWKDSDKLGYFMKVSYGELTMTYAVPLCVYECMYREERKRVRDYMYKKCSEEILFRSQIVPPRKD